MRLAILGIALSAVAACGGTSTPSQAGAPAGGLSPAAPAARPAFDGPLPPLPVVQFAAARPAPVTRAAYEFAARHPDVLKHVPCFCGCERNGHRNNEDCFIARRNADNSPEWSPHGIGCGICIDVAREAARLHKEGVPLAGVRAAIDRKYRSEYPTSTATPAPPAGPSHD
jgi:hypothetical protein